MEERLVVEFAGSDAFEEDGELVVLYGQTIFFARGGAAGVGAEAGLREIDADVDGVVLFKILRMVGGIDHIDRVWAGGEIKLWATGGDDAAAFAVVQRHAADVVAVAVFLRTEVVREQICDGCLEEADVLRLEGIRISFARAEAEPFHVRHVRGNFEDDAHARQIRHVVEIAFARFGHAPMAARPFEELRLHIEFQRAVGINIVDVIDIVAPEAKAGHVGCADERGEFRLDRQDGHVAVMRQCDFAAALTHRVVSEAFPLVADMLVIIRRSTPDVEDRAGSEQFLPAARPVDEFASDRVEDETGIACFEEHRVFFLPDFRRQRRHGAFQRGALDGQR